MMTRDELLQSPVPCGLAKLLNKPPKFSRSLTEVNRNVNQAPNKCALQSRKKLQNGLKSFWQPYLR